MMVVITERNVTPAKIPIIVVVPVSFFSANKGKNQKEIDFKSYREKKSVYLICLDQDNVWKL